MAAGLKFRIDGDGSGWTNALKKAEQDAANIGKSIGGKVSGSFTGAMANAIPALTAGIAGAFTFEGIKSAVDDIKALALELKHAHEKSKIGYEDLQVYEVMAKKSGMTLDDVVKAQRKLTIERAKALSNGKNSEEAQNFERLGIAFDKLKASRPADVFKEVQENLSKMGDLSNVADVITATMGKTAYEMVGFFEASFSETEKKARDLGKIINGEVVQQINQGVKLMGEKWAGIKSQLLAPILNYVLQFSNSLIAGFQTGADGIAAALLKKKAMLKAVFSGAFLPGGGKEFEEYKNRLDSIDSQISERRSKREKKLSDSFSIAPERDMSKGLDTDKQTEKAQREALKELQKQLREMAEKRSKADFDGLSTEEKRTALLREQVALKTELSKFQGPGTVGEETEAAKKKIRMAEISIELSKLKPDKKEPKEQKFDSLAAIGGFRGPVANMTTEILRDSLKVQQAIAENTGRIADQTANLGETGEVPLE